MQLYLCFFRPTRPVGNVISDKSILNGDVIVMYTVIRSIRSRSLLAEQSVIMGISLLIAELFYKFHSFTLECIAFLATWFVLDTVVSELRLMLMGRRSRTGASSTSEEKRSH